MWKYLFIAADSLDFFLMFVGTISAAINGLALPSILLFASHLYDHFGKHSSNEYTAKHFALLYFMVSVITLVAGYLQTICWMRTGDRRARKLQEWYMQSLLRQDAQYFDSFTSTAQAINDISNSIKLIRDAIGEKIGSIIRDIILFVGACLLGGILMWRLFLLLVPFIPLIVIPSVYLAKVIKGYSINKLAAHNEAGLILKEALSSLTTTCAFTAEDRTLKLYSRVLEKVVKLEKLESLVKGVSVGVNAFTWILWAFILWYGSSLVIQAKINGAELLVVGYAFITGSMQLTSAFENMKSISEAHAAMENISSVLNKTKTVHNDGEELKQVEGHIGLKHVSFAYPTRPQQLVLDNISLHVPAGEITALVGRSGCGKSTIIALLERFYEHSTGEITLDGLNIKRLNIEWYRDLIGHVSQEPALLSTSIKQNILFGRQHATMEEVIDAAAKAHAHDFIKNLPNGYETHVGELGIQISGGQKQRIAIARAILRNPKIMLLDEATGSLDNESEKAVQEALDKLCISMSMTTLTITHKLSSIKNAHNVVVMDSGRVIEQGKQQELINKQSGIYASMISAAINKDTPKINEDYSLNQSEYGEHKTTPSFQGISSLTSIDWKKVFVGLAACNTSGIIKPLIFFISGAAISSLYTEGPDQLKRTVKAACGLYIMNSLLLFISSVVQYYYVGVTRADLCRSLQEKMLAKILQFEVAWFDREENSSAALYCHLVNDPKMITAVCNGSLVETLMTLVFCIGASFILSWRVSFVGISVQLVIALVCYLRLKLLVQLKRGYTTQEIKLSQLANDVVKRHKTIEAYNLQANILSSLESIQLCNPSVYRISGISHGISLFVLYGFYSVYIWYGGVLIREQRLTFKRFLICFGLILSIGHCLREVMALAPDIANAWIAKNSILQILNRKTKKQLSSKDDDDTVIQGAISFDKVSFAYPSRKDVLILNEFTAKFDSGETVAIVGKSGAGKSTIIALIERFYDAIAGHILLDGQDITRFNVKLLRRHIGLVSQEPILFAMSIRDNIAYGRENASDAEIIEAATIANAHAFICALADGYATKAGEGGAQLSGGQKQRIAIARAILKKPPIMLLDEATSALDSEAEQAVQHALDRITSRKMTTLIVAHRLSAVRNAHNILVLENGAILEQGSHYELVSKQGAYCSLLQLQ